MPDYGCDWVNDGPHFTYRRIDVICLCFWYDLKMKELIILRGYPGSGKATIGKILQTDGLGTFIDHNAILTFIANIVGDDNGIYDDIHKLEIALTNKLLEDGTSVIVARGFCSIASMRPYFETAKNARVAVTDKQIAIAKTKLDDNRYDHSAWFFGTGDIIRWFGYSYGYKLCKKYSDKHNKSASELVHTPAHVILGKQSD